MGFFSREVRLYVCCGFSRGDADIKWPGAYRFRAVRDHRLGPRQEEGKTSAMHALAQARGPSSD